MAGGVAPGGGGGGPVDLAAVPNRGFILLVAAFSAMGGLLFGYDTGINGGVKVSRDFIEAFCASEPAWQRDCSCYGPGYQWELVVGAKTQVAEMAWVAGDDGLLDDLASQNEEICVGPNAEGVIETRWACDCFAPLADRVPTGWNTAKGSFVSWLSFGAMVGALGAGQLAEPLGRRKTISLVSGIFVLGTAVCCKAHGSLTTLLVGRVLIGFPIGALSTILPMYAAEIAPREIRGVLGTLFQLAIVVGILLATVVAIPIESMVDGWQFALGIAALPAGLLAVGIWKFPESPRWLLQHHDLDLDHEHPASISLQTLRAQSADEVRPELLEMQRAIAAESGATAGSAGYKDLLAPPIRHRVLLGVGLQVLQQATGVNAIFYFAPTIFEDAGVEDPLACALATGVANLFGTFVAIRLVDEKGRRTLLMWSRATTKSFAHPHVAAEASRARMLTLLVAVGPGARRE